MGGGKQVRVADSDFDEVDSTLRAVLADTLGLPKAQVAGFTDTTPLFGTLPELDSMAVASLLTALEERFAMMIEDDDVEAEDFATYGTLLAFVKRIALR